jgi:hypothetical protein
VTDATIGGHRHRVSRTGNPVRGTALNSQIASRFAPIRMTSARLRAASFSIIRDL